MDIACMSVVHLLTIRVYPCHLYRELQISSAPARTLILNPTRFVETGLLKLNLLKDTGESGAVGKFEHCRL